MFTWGDRMVGRTVAIDVETEDTHVTACDGMLT